MHHGTSESPGNPSGLTLVSGDLRPDTALPLPTAHLQLHHSRKSLYSFQDLEDCPTLLIPKPRAVATSATPSAPAACASGHPGRACFLPLGLEGSALFRPLSSKGLSPRGSSLSKWHSAVYKDPSQPSSCLLEFHFKVSPKPSLIGLEMPPD
jgi:hypothetical protein